MTVLMVALAVVDGTSKKRPRSSTLAVRRRREEWHDQEQLAELLEIHLDRSGAWSTSLENKPMSRVSGVFYKRRGVRSGLPDVLVLYRRKPSARCPR